MNAYAFLNSQSNSLVSNALLSKANTDLNGFLCDGQDNLNMYVLYFCIRCGTNIYPSRTGCDID